VELDERIFEVALLRKRHRRMSR